MSARPTLRQQLFRRKPLHSFESDATDGGLRRTVGPFQLTMIGIGATIGTGIFFLLSAAVPEAGPAVIVSLAIAAAAAALTALCYAELASAVPVSGSSYSYAYATLGEFPAWAVGWCLLLEYAVSGAAIAVSWGQYLNDLTERLFAFRMPEALSAPPGAGGVVNLPGVVLVALCCLLLVRGAKESALINTVMVLVKLGVLALFVVVGATGFDSGNLQPFAPLGLAGISTAAATVFFAFIGLDAVSTAGDEVRDPRRTLPLAIVGALVVVTTAYVLVAVVGVGAQPWTAFEGQEAGLSAILADITGSGRPAVLLSAGAVLSIVSVTLVVLYGQSRILYTMGRDGMLPAAFHRVGRRSGTPVFATLLTGAFVAVLAAVFPLDLLTDLTSMGTLAAFTVVSLGVLILRRTAPGLERRFRVPGHPVIPVLSILACGWLMYELPLGTYVLFGGWLALSLAVYLLYSRKNSQLEADAPTLEPASCRNGKSRSSGGGVCRRIDVESEGRP
ncbi:amino acid permease [Streptomyces sp. NPDC048623]|uniref:APC family permease n=1 Tax=Streptomyces sp. NPDC048623 TaxID=3155761 RepID=UPI003440F53C